MSRCGPWPIRWRNGYDSVLYICRKLCQTCTLVKCEMRGQGNVGEVYEYSVRETVGSKGTVVWGSENVSCSVNTLDFRNDADSSCYICV